MERDLSPELRAQIKGYRNQVAQKLGEVQAGNDEIRAAVRGFIPFAGGIDAQVLNSALWAFNVMLGEAEPRLALHCGQLDLKEVR